MKIYRNLDFIARDPECTNIVAVRGETPPPRGNWRECSEVDALEIECMNLTQLYRQAGRAYLGYL